MSTGQNPRQTLVTGAIPHPPPKADEVRIMARLDAIERKLDQVLEKLGRASVANRK
jgi:hypothetical protein